MERELDLLAKMVGG